MPDNRPETQAPIYSARGAVLAPSADAVATTVSEVESGGKTASNPSMLRVEAEGLMAERRWAEAAAAVFERIAKTCDEAAVQGRLARNLQAIETHCPEILGRLLDDPACTECGIARTSAGELTIVQRPLGGSPVLLTTGVSAEKACQDGVESLSARAEEGTCIALCGVGDGYLLKYLAANPPEMFLDREHAVFVFEPHPEVLLQVLMIHDLSGDDGPFAQRRFQWCLGADWAEQAEELLRTRVYLPYPEHFVALSMVRGMMEKRVSRFAERLIKWEKQQIDALHEQYARRSRKDWLAIFSENPPRPPRAMLITSRFTTVLQYSTADIAAGLEEEGWETAIVIESERHEMVCNRAILSTMIEFDPDIVIQIDHLRRERVKLYPADLPFVCWIQDELPNLTTRKAGQSVGLRDFVLTCAHSTYIRRYHYPARQMIFLEKLTRGPSGATRVPGNGPPDLAYVSNASKLPEDILHDVVGDFDDIPKLQAIIEASGRRMIGVYESGGSIVALHHIRAIIEEESTKQGGEWKSQDHLDGLVLRMSGHLNNALYRQQALDWVIEIAEDRGLSLELYGQGWENHPKFARFAKGSIQYGEALEELTQRAKINLQIVPYSCMHQRLLDGLSAGGFFLIRDHPVDVHHRRIAEFMTQHLTPSIRSIEDARKAWPNAVQHAFNELLRPYREETDYCGPDLIESWRQFEEQGLRFIYEGLPLREEVSFNDRNSLERALIRFIDDPEKRREILTVQSEFIKKNFTYRGGFKRIMRQIGHLIATEETDVRGKAD